MSFKRCSKCKTLLPACFGHFYRQKATSDGYTSWCRICDRTKSREDKRIARLMGKVKKTTPEKGREYVTRSRNKDLEKSRLNDRECQKRRREKPEYRLMSNVGRRVRDMLTGRQGSTRNLAYSGEELVNHIKRQFVAGMTLENYGAVWHIDHIVPVTAFKIDGPDSDGFKACWALTNLRPLWAFDNMSKGSKNTHLI